MSYRHIMQILGVTLPVCVILKTMQTIFTIDSTTGFIKQQYSVIGVLISVIICAAVAAISLMTLAINELKEHKLDLRPGVSAASLLVGGIFIFVAVANVADVSISTWYDVALVILSVLSAFSFLAYGLKNIYKYDMPSIIMVIPAVYYILKLINIFISKSKLAPVTENVFSIIINCTLLLFMFEFACLENEIGETQKRQKEILVYGIASFMMCITTAVPKLFLVLFTDKTVYRVDIANSVLNIAIAIFVMSYIYRYADKKPNAVKFAPKHQA